MAAVAFDVAKQPEAHADQAYILSGAEQLDFDQVAAILSDVLGRPIRYTQPGLPQFWARMWRRGVSWDTLTFMTIVYTLTRLGGNEPLTDTLPKLLGRPPTSFRQFAEDYKWRWEQQQWT